MSNRQSTTSCGFESIAKSILRSYCLHFPYGTFTTEVHDPGLLAASGSYHAALASHKGAESETRMAREFTVGGKGSQLRTAGPGPGDSYLAERKVLQIDGPDRWSRSILLIAGGRTGCCYPTAAASNCRSGSQYAPNKRRQLMSKGPRHVTGGTRSRRALRRLRLL